MSGKCDFCDGQHPTEDHISAARFKTTLDLDHLKCLRLSEATDQFHFLDTLAQKHNELVAFLAEALAK